MDAHQAAGRQAGAVKVHVIADRELAGGVAEDVQQLLALSPGPIEVTFERWRVPRMPLDEDQRLPWSTIFATIQQVRDQCGWPDEDVVCLLTPTENENNWFSANALQHRWFCTSEGVGTPDPTATNSFFVHVGDFSWATTASQGVIAASRIVMRVLDHVLALNGRSIDMHEEARGCLFDFCEDKTELRFKMQTAAICGGCLDCIESMPGADALLRQVVDILERCRLSALPSARYLRQALPEGVWRWPHPVAVTAHFVERTPDKDHFERFNRQIDHLDCLIRCTAIIARCWWGDNLQVRARPSLGDWAAELAAVGKAHSIEAIQGAASIVERQQLVSLRNEWRGHGYVRAESRLYEERQARLGAILRQVESALEPVLRRYQLVIPDGQIGFPSSGDCFELQGVKVVGSNPYFPRWRFETRTDPRALGVRGGAVMVTDVEHSRFVSVEPHIVRDMCPTCGVERVLVTDGQQYIDVAQGHRIRLSSA